LSSTAELDHAGVHVADLERSVAFYRDVLGLEERTRLRLGHERLVFFAAGAGFLELIADDTTSPRAAGVVDHVALRVADLDAQVARLRAAEVRLLDAAPVDVRELNARILFCVGPDGERIELIERRDQGSD
jgi:lactoylglutathione lyase